MIHDPWLIVLFLLFIEFIVLYAAAHPKLKKYFSFLPSVFWIYFVPMLCSTAGLLDPKAAIYQQITNWLLPASLVLLLLSCDLKAIARLGRPAILMMLSGTLGVMVGIPIVFVLFKSWVGPEMWSGFGALSASWVGGSANMIAVKEAVGSPDAVFAPMVVVDTVVPYVWMGFLIAASGFQWQYDRINQSDRKILNDLERRAKEVTQNKTVRLSLQMTVVIIVVAVLSAFLSRGIATALPVIKDVLSTYAWTIIAATLIGIGISLTPMRSLEDHGASKIGYFLLYFVLTTIGAKASIANVGAVVILIVAGFLVIVIHAGFVLFAARIIRAPMFLAAVASQANIGGVASAPVIAEVYQPGLASIGLLLAIFGNITGTYTGILTAQICRLLSGS